MKSFEHASVSADEFVQKVKAVIANRELGKMTTIAKAGDEIVVTISKMGTTEIRYAVAAVGSGFKAHLSNEKIAFAHRPFRADIEGKLQSVMEKLGAKCV